MLTPHCPFFFPGIMALLTDIAHMAEAMGAIELAVRDEKDRIAIDRLLELCAEAAVGATG